MDPEDIVQGPGETQAPANQGSGDRPLSQRQHMTGWPEIHKGSLILYQRMMGLPETGILDEFTTAMMRKPRCGNRDIETPHEQATRKKRRDVSGKSQSYSLRTNVT